MKGHKVNRRRKPRKNRKKKTKVFEAVEPVERRRKPRETFTSMIADKLQTDEMVEEKKEEMKRQKEEMKEALEKQKKETDLMRLKYLKRGINLLDYERPPKLFEDREITNVEETITLFHLDDFINFLDLQLYLKKKKNRKYGRST